MLQENLATATVNLMRATKPAEIQHPDQLDGRRHGHCGAHTRRHIGECVCGRSEREFWRICWLEGGLKPERSAV